MASAPMSQPESQASAAVQAFAAERYVASGAARFGIDVAGLAALLAEVVSKCAATEERDVLQALHLEELVLSRACIEGNDVAWEIFLTRYRTLMYEAAHKIAHDEAAARALADSLYAELYGLVQRSETRNSKLRYYLGRGSLAGWLRTVIAQEYVNQYRHTKRETSLESLVEAGKQFAAERPETPPVDGRVEAATASELATLPPQERFLLAAYYLEGRTLAEIAKLLKVHESTVSRKLERVAAGVRKRIRKRLTASGMTPRQADEAMEEVDVRDLQVPVRQSIGQDRNDLAFYKSREEG